MTQRYLLPVLWALMLLCSPLAQGQTSDEFWFAPPEVTSGHVTDNPIVLRIATGVAPATVTIEQPANAALFNGGAPMVVFVPANSATTVDLTADLANLESSPSDAVLTTGLHISSTSNITCYYEVNTGFNPDIFALKGRNGLGQEFYTPFQNVWRNGVYTPTPYTSFDIVATEDNTTVLIYSRVPLDGGHPALTSYTVTLMRGEVYSGSVTSTLGSDNPAGTIIVSDKDIAVSIKDDSVWPQPAGCRDLIGDQIVPVNIVGTEYIVNQGGLTVQEKVFITATQNNTQVEVAGVPVATLFNGETLEVDINDPLTYITTTEPSYCLHVSGFGCEVGGAILPPLNCAGSDRVNFVRSTTEYFGLNILVRAGAEGDFVLNGSTTLIPAGAFAPVPGTGGAWVGATISYNTTDILVGANNLITNSTDVFAVGLINGGASSGCRFGYFSEFAAQIVIDAGGNQTVCANDSADLNGSVTGGTTTGIWTSSGSGTFLPDDVTLNATYAPSAADISAGSVTLTLTSTGNCFPVTDNALITFTTGPSADAGIDQTACGNNPSVTLNGAVTIASGGLWSGGAGTFNPSNTVLNPTYTPTAAEIAGGTLTLTLTTTGNGNCNPETDDMVITFGPSPTSNAGVDQTVCSNNPATTLGGAVTIATGGIWSGGAGTFNPSTTDLNAIYTPTAGEISGGSVTLTLTTTGNGGCNAVADNMTISFTNGPSANAGPDQTLCSNNADINLAGSVTVATGGQWTGGLGVFTPSSNDLNAVYSPSAAEISSGTLQLVLTTTGNGGCLAETDTVDFNFTAAPTADAGIDQTVCGNNPNLTLAGAVTIATGGTWSGGAGTFNPNVNTLNATYTPSAAEISAGSVTLTLTTNGNGTCNPVSDDMTVTITPAPVVNAGIDQSVCANNSDITLSGTVAGAGGGVWTGGAGTFNPSNTALNAIYTPTAGELSSGSLVLTLTSTGNGNCNAEADNMMVTFTLAPTANAGPDQTLCENNANISLNGSITVASGGQWTGGLGTFTPSNTSLNATYTPTAGEIASGSLTLTLTSTGNGNCLAASDQVDITFTAGPVVDAGADQSVCANNPALSLGGSVTIAAGAIWSGGAGGFAPSNTDLNATYTPTAGEIAGGSMTLYLTSFGNGTCNPAVDSLVITFTPSPTVDAGVAQSVCENNPDVTLNGVISGATGGIWTGGTGNYNPSNTSVSVIYTPSPGEIIAGFATLTLTSTGNGNCLSENDNVTITISPAPTANAGPDQTLCENNSTSNLAGAVTIASGGQWSGGLGIFNPNNTDLNASYTPSASEISNGSVTLTLTTTGNGACLAETDDITLTFTTAPTADAGPDQSVCANNADVTLAGVITLASGGIWSGGNGTFTPNNTSLTATYSPSAAEILAGSVRLYLTTTGNGTCLSALDSMDITITPVPVVNAGPNLASCANNPTINLAGIITNAGGGQWTGGAGVFNPSNTDLNAAYTPTASEIVNGTLTLTLTSTGNGNCAPVADSLVVTIGPPPSANAGADQTACANNANVILNGSVTQAAGGQWTGGLGSFTPSANDLNATYTPTATEIASGTLTLTLTTTGNGACNPESDDMVITFTPAPVADAGLDQTVCANNAIVNLSGAVSGATGGTWTGGLGTFSPSANDLNATYTPTAAEIAGGSIALTLTTTGNGNCLAESNDMLITITQAPIVLAGMDQTICVSNLNVVLSGLVSGSTTTGQWTTTGTGVFVPSNMVLNPTYQASAQDSANGQVVLILTSTNNGNCLPEVDSLDLFILPAGTSNAGADVTVCANDPQIQLNGVVGGNASSGVWSTSGTGAFSPDVNTANAIYIPSAGDIGLGSVTLTFTANSCNAAADDLLLTITPAPMVDAGPDQTVCFTTLNIPLNGSVSGASTTGQWTTLGTGTFSPSNTALNADYVASSADSAAQTVILILEATNIGNCLPVTDTVILNIFPPGLSDAGPDQVLCANSGNVALNGSITGGATEGVWTTNGSGFFTPSDTALNASYVPSSQDTAIGTVNLVLTSTNSCNAATDFMNVIFTPAAFVEAGPSQTICGTSPVVSLNGMVSGITSSGTWTTSGSGTFTPSANDLNADYNASAGDVSAGSVWLFLTSTNNGTCLPVTDSLQIIITDGIVVDAGADQLVCITSQSTTLQGSVSNGSTTGQWTTLGSGTFSPNDSTLNGSYTYSTPDTTAGSVMLILTSTNNGNCAVESDTMTITFGGSVFVDAGADQTLCVSDTSVALNGLVTGGATDGVWTTFGTGSFTPSDSVLSTNYSFSAADSTAGLVQFVLTSFNNGSCAAGQDTINVVLDPLPIISAGPDQEICSTGDSVYLAGSVQGAMGGVWTSSGTGTFVNDSIPNAVYVASIADSIIGTVTFTYTSYGNGACASMSDNAALSFGGLEVANAGADQTICASTVSITLAGNTTSGQGIWTTSGDGTFSPSDTILNATYLPGTADSVIGSVNLILTPITTGCPPISDTAVLTIDPIPTVDAGPDLVVCTGTDSVPMAGTVSNAGGVLWSTDGSGLFIPNATDPQATYLFSGADAGLITMILTTTSSGVCPGTADTMTVLLDNPVSAGFVASTACVNAPMSFTDTSSTMTGSITDWDWDFGDGNGSNQDNPTHPYQVSGNYTVTLIVTSNQGCMDTAINSVTVSDYPIAEFTWAPATGVMTGDVVNFTNQSTGSGSWVWNFGDNTGFSTDENPQHTFLAEGTFEVSLWATNATGCTDSVSYFLAVEDSEVRPPKAPTGFSPDGDGTNDTFIVRGGPFEEIDFTVYNDWGEQVFNTTDPTEGWDGTFKGQDAPQGVYIYTVKATVDGVDYTRSGKVTLIR